MSQATSTGPQYHWATIPGSDRLVLCLDDQRLGVYDPKTQVYRRVDANGRLSAPAAPPWESTQPTVASTPAKAAEQPPAGDLPPWTNFVVGGGVAGLTLIVGFGSKILRG